VRSTRRPFVGYLGLSVRTKAEGARYCWTGEIMGFIIASSKFISIDEY
jgi:hypothetical protein